MGRGNGPLVRTKPLDLLMGRKGWGMIRRLGESDRASVITLLSAAPQLNLYILGNLHTYGFDADFCEYFGDVEDGHLRALVNRYATGWTVYGEGSADWVGLGAVVDSHGEEAERLQDNPGGIESFLPYLQGYVAASLAICHLMELPDGGLQPQSARAGFVVRKATMDDLAGLIALFTDAGHMSRTPASTNCRNSAVLPGTTPPQKATSTKHCPRAASSFVLNPSSVVVGGMLLSGMSTIVVTPPAAAARVAVA